MYRIVVISDTHARSLDQLPPPILEALPGADIIVHAGDFTEKDVLDGLRTLGEVRAVHGNADSAELKEILPSKDEFRVGGKIIGVIHGSGAPWSIAVRVRSLFRDVDIIIFGHSHQVYNGFLDGALLFNPGSARNTFGLLTIDDMTTARVIEI